MFHPHAQGGGALSDRLACDALLTDPAPPKIYLGKAAGHRCWSRGGRCCLWSFWSSSSFFLRTDLAVYICSHNRELRPRLMASNSASLARKWHFHTGHRGNVFFGGTEAGFVCLHPSVLSSSCCTLWHGTSAKYTPLRSGSREGSLGFG